MASERLTDTVENVMVFKIPPFQSIKTVKCTGWSKFFIWKGHAQIWASSTSVTVRFVDRKTHSLFAEAPVNMDDLSQTLEQVSDSSRYFLIRVANPNPGPGQPRRNWLGIGWNERGASFDFRANIQEAIDRLKRLQSAQSSAAAAGLTLDDGDDDEFSIKDDTPLTIAMGGMQTGMRPTPAHGRDSFGRGAQAGGGGGQWPADTFGGAKPQSGPGTETSFDDVFGSAASSGGQQPVGASAPKQQGPDTLLDDVFGSAFGGGGHQQSKSANLGGPGAGAEDWL